jgi:hypothetical protein
MAVLAGVVGLKPDAAQMAGRRSSRVKKDFVFAAYGAFGQKFNGHGVSPSIKMHEH